MSKNLESFFKLVDDNSNEHEDCVISLHISVLKAILEKAQEQLTGESGEYLNALGDYDEMIRELIKELRGY